MTNSFKIVEFTLFLILIITLINNSVQQECNESANKRIDGIMAKLLTIGNSGRKFPESKGDDLKKYCDDTKKYVEEIESFKNRCLKDLPKQVTGVIVYAIRNTLNQLCKKDSKRLDEVLSATPCLNKAQIHMNKCYTRYIDAVLGAKNAAEDKKKIPYICCAYVDLYTCSEPRMKKVKRCSDKDIDIGLNFVRSLFGNVIDLICGEYNESTDKCTTIEKAPKKLKSQRRAKSFLVPLIDLLSSFPEL